MMNKFKLHKQKLEYMFILKNIKKLSSLICSMLKYMYMYMYM